MLSIPIRKGLLCLSQDLFVFPEGLFGSPPFFGFCLHLQLVCFRIHLSAVLEILYPRGRHLEFMLKSFFFFFQLIELYLLLAPALQQLC